MSVMHYTWRYFLLRLFHRFKNGVRPNLNVLHFLVTGVVFGA